MLTWDWRWVHWDDDLTSQCSQQSQGRDLEAFRRQCWGEVSGKPSILRRFAQMQIRTLMPSLRAWNLRRSAVCKKPQFFFRIWTTEKKGGELAIDLRKSLDNLGETSGGWPTALGAVKTGNDFSTSSHGDWKRNNCFLGGSQANVFSKFIFGELVGKKLCFLLSLL